MSTWLTHARGVLVLAGALLLFAGCRRGERCATCGMRIDATSAWMSYVTIGGKEEPFDTPSCAFAAWRKASSGADHARFREYYSQELKPVEELRFVRGSDVVGPMGPDLVPVAEATARRFARDHNGAPPQTADEIVRGEAP
jgi:copper chaperone NosL